jgi:hypothetical protein
LVGIQWIHTLYFSILMLAEIKVFSIYPEFRVFSLKVVRFQGVSYQFFLPMTKIIVFQGCLLTFSFIYVLGFVSVSEDDNRRKCERAIKQLLHQIERLCNVLSQVLPANVYYKSIGQQTIHNIEITDLSWCACESYTIKNRKIIFKYCCSLITYFCHTASMSAVPNSLSDNLYEFCREVNE